MKKLLFTLIIIALQIYVIFGQCYNCVSQYPSSVQSITCGTTVTVSTLIYGGEYQVYNVTSGNTYTWSTCGDSDFDTYLTLFQGSTCGSGSVISYNDDACGLQSTISWTATFTGTVTLLVSQYSCISNSTSMTVTWSCTGGGSPPSGGGADCANADPFCTGTTYDFPMQTDNGSGEVGPNYGCLCTTPNPVWYYLKIATSGNIGITISSTCGDIDYAAWGPFSAMTCSSADLTSSGPICTTTNYDQAYPNMVDCAYSTAATEVLDISNAIVGQYYLLCITNYANCVGNAVFSQTSGTGATDCSIVIPCDVGTITTSVPNCPTGGNYTVTGTVSFSDAPTTGTMTICDSPSGICQTFSAPFTSPTSYSLSGIPANGTSHTITVSFSNEPFCTGTQTYTATKPLVSATNTNVNPSCNGGSNGSISLTVSGGTAGYTYTWSPNVSSTNNATGLSAGTYNVTIRDALGCTRTYSYTLTNPAVMTISATPAAATCGSPNGTITVNVTAGGVANYTYTCPPAATSSGNPSSTYTFTGLAAGTYPITVTNGNGCTATTSATITTTGSVTSTFTYNGNQCLSGNLFNFTNTGTGGATYSWTFPSGSPPTSTATNPSGVTWSTAGTYTVTHVVTLGSCTSTSTQNITVYGQPTATITPTNVTCFGACNGSALATGSGGSGTYSYLWSTSSTSQNITALCASPPSYTVTVTDTYGCKGTATVNITQPAALNVVTTRTNPTCNGACNGTAQATVTGGSGSFTYAWSNLATGPNITGLCAGTYTVTVTDVSGGAGCTQTANVVLNNPAAIVLTGSSVPATCGASNGSATVTITSGGTPNYTYNWSNSSSTPNTPSTTNTITGIASGSYTVTVTTGNGCTATTTVNVSSTGAPTATITSNTPPLCFGGCNGTATVSIGGTLNSPFTYTWSSGASTTSSPLTTNTANNLCAGNNTVTVTDNLGCVVTANVNITQPAQVTTSTATTNATCGLSNGSATVNAIGGTGVYNYSWSPGGATTQTITNKPAGTYSVTVTDGNGCSSVNTATIVNTAGVTASVSGTTQPLCNGSANGTATAQGTGGTLPYTYAWSYGSQTTQTAINLPAGTYTVTVTDLSGCTSTATTTVTQPAVVTATISASTPATCNASCNGTATVTPGGGTPPYTYLWSNIQTIPNATGLCNGTYSVTVKDANNCTATTTVNITQPTVVTATTSTVSAHCGLPDGSATVAASGGTPGYTYLWSAGGQVSSTATNLIPGTYTVTVRDANGCTYVASATVGNLSSGTAVISNTTPVTCNGLCNGSITVSASGGTFPYSYMWSPGGQTTVTATNLCAGNYTVSVTDASGCVVTASSTVNQPPALAVNTTMQNISCFGGCDGSLNAVPSGGTSPYTYQWSNTVFTANNPNLCSGTYIVTVTDASGCTITATRTLSPPPAMTLSEIVTQSTCGQSDGSITINITNGAPPFNYTWVPNLGTGPSLSNIPSGNYSVTVTDFKGCSATGVYNVPDAGGVTATLGPKTNVSCYGLCNGTASVTASGGTGPYTYAWNDPWSQTTTTATNLCAGTFSVSVIDSTGCVSSASVIITQPAMLTVANITSVSPLCNGDCNGTANVIATGGTTPYSYLWSGGIPNGGSTPTASITSNICSGALTVLVTDANGCTITGSTFISEPPFMSLSTSVHNMSCSGANDGDITVSAIGGIPPYTYLWSPSAGNQTSQTAYNLGGGSHSVTVTDDNGCTATISATVTTPNPIVFTTTPVHITCFAYNNGSITLNGSGGTPPYTFAWTNSLGTYSSSQQNIGNLAAETYTVTITDANYCSSILSTIISQPPQFTLNTFNTDETCFQFCDGTITTAPSGGQQPWSYLWSNLSSSPNLLNMCPGIYTVTVTDNNGCTVSRTDTILGNPLLQVDLVSTTPATCGMSNGSASVVVQGGATGYTMQWSTGGNALIENNMPAGNHTLILIDNNGCIDTLSVSIQNFNGPTITSVTPSHVTCAGLNNGVAIVNYNPSSPPAPPYTTTWSNGWIGDTATGLAGGLYYVTVVDINGCQSSSTIIINEPTQLVGVVNYASANPCYGVCSAMATSMAAGGTPPYTYNWLGIGQTTPTATGLCAGIYNLVVTDAMGCTSSSQGIVTQPAEIDIVGTVTDVNCYNNATGIISVVSTGGSPPHQFIWLPPAFGSTSVAANLLAGTYQVVVTDGNSCTATESFTVTQPSQIVVTTSVAPAACGNPIGVAQADNVTGGIPPYSYLWSPGNQTTPQISNLTNGIYQLQVTDFNGCIVQQTLPVGMVPGPQIVTFNITNTSCYGINTGIAEADPYGGTAPYTFAWNNGQSDSIATNLMAGTYSVTVTDANGCSIGSVTTIGQPSQIQVIPLGCDTICQNQSAIIAATANGGTPPYEFFWTGPDIVNPNGQFQNVAPLTTTNYSVYVVDTNGCVSSPPANITVNVFPGIFVTISPDAVICEGQQHSINVQASGGRPPYSFVWNLGSGNPNVVSPIDTTTYTVEVYDACSTTPGTATMTIFVKEAPKLSNTPVYQSGCVPLAAQFSATLTVNDTNVTFLWNFGDPNAINNTSTAQYTSHVYNFPGTYDVTLTISDGTCPRYYLLDDLVDVFPSPDADFVASPQQTDIFHSTVTFFDQSNLASQWLWYFGDGQMATSINPAHTYEFAGTYDVTLLVRSSNNCIDSAKLTITIQEAHTFYAPNAFCPYNGFNNFYFYPKGLGIDVDEYNLLIFDRWGQLVFSTNVYPPGTDQVQITEGGWNGRYNNTGEIVPIGTYVWQVKCKDVNGIYREYTGNVTVVR